MPPAEAALRHATRLPRSLRVTLDSATLSEEN